MDHPALTAARANGFVELDFTGSTDDESEPLITLLKVADTWTTEAVASNRHSIVVGHKGDEHFLLWSRRRGREYRYFMVGVWNILRSLAEEPIWNVHRLSLLASVKTPEAAVKAAQQLVKLDRTPRNPALELGLADPDVWRQATIEA